MAYIYGSYPTSLFVFDQIFASFSEMNKIDSPKPFIGRYAYIRYATGPIDDQTKYILHTYTDREQVISEYGEGSLALQYWDNWYLDDGMSYDCTVWKMTPNGYEYITRIDSAGLASSDNIEYIITGGTTATLLSNGFLSGNADDYWYSFEELIEEQNKEEE